MSLLDTIKGAREEAQEATAQRTITKKENTEEAGTDTTSSTQAGFSRRSAARAKPMREAAGSVRVGEKAKAEMSKEEKKAEREARRSEEDLIYDAKRAILEEEDGYKHTQRIWWGMLIAGVIMTVISWGIMTYMRNSGLQDSKFAFVSIACMTIAYMLVIGAFIYDIVKVRPLRRAADEKVMGMTKRRRQRVSEEAAERKAAKKAKK